MVLCLFTFAFVGLGFWVLIWWLVVLFIVLLGFGGFWFGILLFVFARFWLCAFYDLCITGYVLVVLGFGWIGF